MLERGYAVSITALMIPALTSVGAGAVESVESLANHYLVPESYVEACIKQAGRVESSQYTPRMRDCLKQYESEENVEHIDVYGKYIGLEVPEISGRFYLDKQFIENMPRGSGDINDLILLLPGVQGSENALKASSAGEIRAKLLSISGGQPWQTGFFLDGMNFNSRQDPGSSESGIASVNDVYGAPQTFTVNSDIVDNIQVFDNNIPARFGYFSGGVVDVEGLDAMSSFAPAFSASFRSTSSAWGEFHLLNGFDGEDNSSDSAVDTSIPLEDQVPVYNISSLSVLGSHSFNRHHGILVSANLLKSQISDVSLQQIVETERENTNVLIKYSMRDTWLDRLDWSIMYAPYQNHNLLKNVKDSWFTAEGGGIGSIIEVQENTDWGSWHTELSVNHSENSREAPQHYYIWFQAKGVDWGQYDPNNTYDLDDSDYEAQSFSKEGGYGDLDKTQLSTQLSSYIDLESFEFLGLQHHLQIGASWLRDEMERTRKEDSYYYNSPILYSTSDLDNPLNCSGYTNDCISISYAIPLTELAAQLGGYIDFSNPEHVLAYSDNVLTTPQYFQTRIVYGAENINVDINQFSAYIEDNVDWGRASLRLGLRYDYDDFFKQHNIAPRLSAGIDVFDNGNLLVLGLNRYYDAGLLTYKIKELKRPYYVQYRPIQNGYLQGWTLSSDDSDYRDRYQDVTTPYNDEATIGWKQSTALFGTFSINYVYRWQQDQLARSGESVLDTDGYRYAYQNNSGRGTSQRVSLAWSAKFGEHSLWANISHTQNYRNNNDYDSAIDDAALDDLVYYEGQVITKDQLNRVNANYSRPMTANMGWAMEWNAITAAVTTNYTGSYVSAVSTGGSRQTRLLERACAECAAYNVVVPFYRKAEFNDRILVNLALKYSLPAANFGELEFNLDVNNLLNSRTYLVTPGDSGIETGRRVWVGIKYRYQ